ncbi:MAG TPA: Gfo/Idh/MocA family oxidoreductase [Actinomycetes bacterium]|nr:Gfo/Idh/MocA family oxidoreductase [Actinomycetes bacterium]
MTTTPAAAAAFRWGIIGTGGIAAAFARDVARLPDAEVVAVGSRTGAGADAFGDEHGVARRHASYEELVADRDIDAVYVATPHNSHRDAALLAIDAGHPVLVEKPFTVNAREAEEVLNAARARGLFAMEAMWTRFLPHVVSIRTELAAGTLGTVRAVSADHGQYFPPDPVHRLFAPELAGGALLDLGIYPVSFVSMVLGAPERVSARSSKAFTGVDAQTSAVLEYADGAHGVVTTTLEAKTPCQAWIAGTEARIEVDGTFYAPSAYTLVHRDGRRERREFPFEGHGLRMQAAEVARCVRAGLTESPVLPHAEILSIMSTMDEIRRQIGLRYSWEG